MGLFDKTGDDRQDEVVIEASDEDSSNETRLGKEVETSLIDDDSGSESSSSGGTELGSDIGLKDIHRQNETIIELLEQLVDEKDSSGSSRVTSRSSSSSRVTDRDSGSSDRVTDRKDSSDNDSIGDGMNELL